MYASLDRLGETVAEHLDREDMRVLFEYHRDRVAGLIASQPDVPANETTMAGFLNGFQAAATTLTEDPLLAADTMYPQLGGIYLYVRTLDQPTEVPGLSPPRADGFFGRLSETLRRESIYHDLTGEQHRLARDLLRDAFAETPDVPVNAASLAGFVLGLLYATPFVAEGGIVAVLALMGAARALLPDV